MKQVRTLALLALSALAFHAQVAKADTWPEKPIHLLLPVAPGGSADATARLIQAPLSKILGQPIIIENRAGGMGTISTNAVVRAKPDGYTFGVVYTSHAANPFMFEKMLYNSEKDLTPVAMFWRATMGISVPKDSPYRTLGDLIAAAKAKPGQINYATSGVGQAAHIAMTQLEKAAGISLVHVPYRGGGPAMEAVIGGSVPVFSSGTGLASPYLLNGTLRLLAVTSGTRSKLFPQVPTAAEAGYKGVDMSEWYGFVGPAGLPEPIVKKMNAAINQVLAQAEVQAQFEKWDMTTKLMTPGEFGTYVAEETKHMGVVVKAAGIKIN